MATAIDDNSAETTMNTPKLMYQLCYRNALKKALVKGTFKKAGIHDVRWIITQKHKILVKQGH